MKKLIMAGLTTVTTLALSLGFTACGDTNNLKNESFEHPTTTAQSYSFSAASAGTIISAMNGGSAAQTASAKALAIGKTTVTDEDTIASLNNYMMLVESLLSDGSFGTKYETSDRSEYAIKAVVSYTDITGETISYEMYYNETDKTVKSENGENKKYGEQNGMNVSRYHDDDYDDDDDFDDRYDRDDDNETETKANIAGVLVIDGTDYDFSGRTETETEGNESESKTQFTVTLGENKFMRVEQESENEANEREEEYSYIISENGSVTEKSTFKLEQERDETEIEFKLFQGPESQIFYFEQDADKQNSIRITVGSRDSKQVYFVTIENDENGNTVYVYETADGGRFECERRHNDHD